MPVDVLQMVNELMQQDGKVVFLRRVKVLVDRYRFRVVVVECDGIQTAPVRAELAVDFLG